jgi:hypothetical protein
MKVIAVETVWRYVPRILPNGKKGSYLETTRKGGRCDWAVENAAYRTLGRVRVVGEEKEER